MDSNRQFTFCIYGVLLRGSRADTPYTPNFTFQEKATNSFIKLYLYGSQPIAKTKHPCPAHADAINYPGQHVQIAGLSNACAELVVLPLCFAQWLALRLGPAAGCFSSSPYGSLAVPRAPTIPCLGPDEQPVSNRSAEREKRRMQYTNLVDSTFAVTTRPF